MWVLDELKTSSNFPQKLGTLDDLEIPFKAMLVFATPYFARSTSPVLVTRETYAEIGDTQVLANKVEKD